MTMPVGAVYSSSAGGRSVDTVNDIGCIPYAAGKYTTYIDYVTRHNWAYNGNTQGLIIVRLNITIT